MEILRIIRLITKYVFLFYLALILSYFFLLIIAHVLDLSQIIYQNKLYHQFFTKPIFELVFIIPFSLSTFHQFFHVCKDLTSFK